MAQLTAGQRKFVKQLSSRTGLDQRVVTAWVLHEESGGAAQQRQAQGNNNWLNIAYYDSGPGSLTKNQVWNRPGSAAQATAQFIEGKKYGASPGIQKIASYAGKPPEQQIQAIRNSGWATGRYPSFEKIYGSLDGVPSGAAPRQQQQVSGAHTASVQPTAPPGMDRSQERQGLLLAYLAQRGQPDALATLGYGLRQAQDTTATPANNAPGYGPAAPAPRSPRPVTTPGRLLVAPGANRAGADLTPEIVKLLKQLSARAHQPVQIGTGTNHSQMTTSGNVSDHWSGNAADIPLAGTKLTRRFRQALLTYGEGQTIQFLGNKGVRTVKLTPKTAQQLAREGGIANIQYDGRRVQVIGNTQQGGNHYNHLHVGVSG